MKLAKGSAQTGRMERALFGAACATALILCGVALAQPGDRAPYIGYAYPAGGRVGTSFQVTVGGQWLQDVAKARVTGEGVHVTKIQYLGRMMPLGKDQIDEIKRRIEIARQRQMAARSGAVLPVVASVTSTTVKTADGKPGAAGPKTVELPNHPLLKNLENRKPEEIEQILKVFATFGRRLPTKASISELVVLDVTIDADAALGERELRLIPPVGITPAVRFQVGGLTETCEEEPNDAGSAGTLVPSLPAVLNGQIMPGDVDRFRFCASRGQKLVCEVAARRLNPYFADAVPGWFQAVVTLYDTKGRECAFADDYRFNPDPVLLFEAPEDGIYVLEVRDSIYRGREDFVYRIAVGELPFITGIFPLGGPSGAPVMAAASGWNLPGGQLLLDTRPGRDAIRSVACARDERYANSVPYGVSHLPERLETEPNDTSAAAQRITLPVIVNGRIGRPGDVDVYRFDGRAADEVVVEVVARRLGSPLDSLVRLTDSAGRMIAWNDDREDKAYGLLTHHADSWLRVRLPYDGAYCVQVSDSQSGGGDAHAYRLRVSAPQPDFELIATPATLNLVAGAVAPVTVHAVRRDGFSGDIDVALVNTPSGFTLSGNRIPGGRDRVRMTLTAPKTATASPVALHLEGRARIGGVDVRRSAVPAEDLMQAFAYRHLVPSQELLAMVSGAHRWPPALPAIASSQVRLPAGGSAALKIPCPNRPGLDTVSLALSDPPKGITLGEVSVVTGGIAFAVKADGNAPSAGYQDNLIVEALADVPMGKPGTDAAKRTRRVSLGFLPAVPVEIVSR